MEIDDEDEVIGEYDVIYSGEHSDSLTLMQYPLIQRELSLRTQLTHFQSTKRTKRCKWKSSLTSTT